MGLRVSNKSFIKSLPVYYKSLYFSVNEKGPINFDYLYKRQLFWEQENIFQSKVKWDLLSDEDKEIHLKHKEAIDNGHFSYNDPISNEKMLTRLRHFLRGTCCGKACRHCIYDHSNVTDDRRKEQYKFNSAFWKQRSNLEEYDDDHYFDGSNIKISNKPLSSSTHFSIKLNIENKIN
uniref:Uncharacterized protein n=1 Tax=Clastoptera arizonana TaxID=38151 RepID=A0A1B6C356_9HEMI